MNENLYKKIDDYIQKLFVPEDDVLISTIKSLDKFNIPQYSVFANQGKLLHILALLCEAKRILEIGTLGGYSTIWLARALPNNGILYTIELVLEYAKVAQKNIDIANLSEKVVIKIGEALSVLDILEKEQIPPFDLIFIDAHKPSYIKYFEWALRHSHKGSLIIADNVIRNGEVMNSNSIDEKVQGVQQFNKIVASNSNVISIIIPAITGNGYDGMLLTLVK
ncbi:MAG: O-methyltransferase [Candidatus Lokiarchaeota archaeon]|nr:O-methyltransferase [Candidatus Lokiarchaeota archaeon]